MVSSDWNMTGSSGEGMFAQLPSPTASFFDTSPANAEPFGFAPGQMVLAQPPADGLEDAFAQRTRNALCGLGFPETDLRRTQAQIVSLVESGRGEFAEQLVRRMEAEARGD